jgi:predicted HicB family RNase H-like nuclease
MADTVTVTIRTSKELYKWLQAEAKANNRSLNREIEFKLMTIKSAQENETRKK